MIIRRMGKTIAHQDWFVVVIELMVLVVGVFIGLQADGWNQARKDSNDEQRFLVALHEDILLAEKLSSRVRERQAARCPLLLRIIRCLPASKGLRITSAFEAGVG
jgi:hypothetical protein